MILLYIFAAATLQKLREMEEIFTSSLFTSNVDEFYRLYEFTGSKPLNIEVLTVDDENELIGEFVSRIIWPSALTFVSFIHETPLSNLNILELSSGSGIVPVALEKLGVNKVVATDCCENSLKALEKTFKRNNLSKAKVQELRWGDHTNINNIIDSFGKFDMIIGTDVVYEPESIFPLLETASKLLKNREDSVFYLANHIHRFNPLEDSFKEAVEKLNFRVKEIDLSTLKQNCLIEKKKVVLKHEDIRFFMLTLQ